MDRAFADHQWQNIVNVNVNVNAKWDKKGSTLKSIALFMAK